MWRIASLFWLLVGFGVNGALYTRGTRWFIYTYTSDIEHADTDASVYIILIDANGRQSDGILLDVWLFNDFRQGARDSFDVGDEINLSDVCFIRIYHDNTGDSPGLHLEKVHIRNLRLRTTREFFCDFWVPTQEEERQSNRTIERSPPCSAGYLD
ncbi:lipoxygenase homology domain-containing protein 1-like [Pomacea canaliculata]|uniref:lipoxygenase homology domain-containing protein 1-like n=1 Tax=Pomacea canaliculata TaxID=400727 RepID=UPI000D73D196|nr:lipoxygenase homology domain-containing protein 1-like [Pomacea canaliculata]